MRDLTLTVALAVILILLVNPMHFWMPTSLHMLILVSLIGVVGVFLTLLLREHGGDERDEANRAAAGRFAFFLGASVLIAGIAYQGTAGDIDPWLAAALFAMVAGKVLIHYRSQEDA